MSSYLVSRETCKVIALYAINYYQEGYEALKRDVIEFYNMPSSAYYSINSDQVAKYLFDVAQKYSWDSSHDWKATNVEIYNRNGFINFGLVYGCVKYYLCQQPKAFEDEMLYCHLNWICNDITTQLIELRGEEIEWGYPTH